jgi:hypothetical protein
MASRAPPFRGPHRGGVLLLPSFCCPTSHWSRPPSSRRLLCSAANASDSVRVGVDIDPARLIIGSARYGSARYGSARYGSLRYRAESLARLGSFKISSQLVSS